MGGGAAGDELTAPPDCGCASATVVHKAAERNEGLVFKVGMGFHYLGSFQGRVLSAWHASIQSGHAPLAQVVAAKRNSIIALLSELEESRREEAWLRAFEKDDQRYKVSLGGGPLCGGTLGLGVGSGAGKPSCLTHAMAIAEGQHQYMSARG